MLVAAVTGVTVAASLLLAAGMALSRWSAFRCWPPDGRDWRWATYFGLSGVATAGLLAVGSLDWNTFVFPRPASLVAGAGLVGVGTIGLTAGALDLGMRETEGLEGDVRTGGYYRYTRNPQVVFGFVTIAGAPLLANSDAVLAIAVAMACWFALMPLAEEPWLRDRYGEEYAAYCRSVPRFVVPTTLERLRADWRSRRTEAESNAESDSNNSD